MARSASAATAGFPLAFAALFCASIACRTAWSPPRSSCSATGICSGRSVANIALRCTVDVGSAGRSPRAGPSLAVARPTAAGSPRPAPAAWPVRAARSACTTVAALSLAPAPRRHLVASRRSPSSSRRRFEEPGARMTETSGRALGRPLDLDAPFDRSGDRSGLAGVSARISMPSRLTSTSAWRTEPTDWPAGTRWPRPCPWAGGRPRRARSRTRRRTCSSIRCRYAVTCGGHATSPAVHPRCRARIGIP